MITKKILEWLIRIDEVLMVINLLALLIGAVENPLRASSTRLLFTSIQLWVLTMIVWCAVIVHAACGWLLTIVGLLLSIVGIVPIAFVCLLSTRNWVGLLEFMFQAVLVVGGLMISKRMQHHHDI
jgi:hypothetical protein